MASIEDDNIPLYANIAHEFGHALFNNRRLQIETILIKHFATIIFSISNELKQDETVRLKIIKRIHHILLRLASELLSDLIGALFAGPAFYLSLYEMGWGGSKHLWSVKLSPNDENIRSHPGFNFRLGCIRNIIDMKDFFQNLRDEIKRLNMEHLYSALDFIDDIPEGTEEDRVKIHPELDKESQIIQPLLNKYLHEIKREYELFLKEYDEIIRREYAPIIEMTSVNPHNVAELMLRLDKKILPNIIPTPAEPLLGTPARFQDILVASSLYRFNLLLKQKSDSDEHITKSAFNSLSRVERLTMKAIEASFIQQNFKKWNNEG